MNKIYFTTAAIVTALCSTVPAFGKTFDGPYVGVQAGYETVKAQDPTTELGVLTYDDNHDAFTGGLFAGYDKQVAPRIVIGAEAGMDFSSSDTLSGRIGSNAGSIDPKWSIDLTARAGYLVDDNSLLYIRGGYENARVETMTSGGAGQLLSATENRNGWTVGAGFERQLLQNVSARVEYRYSDLSEGDNTWDRHRVLAGVSYRF